MDANAAELAAKVSGALEAKAAEHAAALEAALREAGVDPESVRPAEPPPPGAVADGGDEGGGNAASSTDGSFSPRAGTGRGDVVAVAQLKAEMEKMHGMMKIGQADLMEARVELAAAAAAAEAAMSEGGTAKEQMERMRRAREQEQALAMRSISTLRALRAELTEKDTTLEKSARRLAEKQAYLEEADGARVSLHELLTSKCCRLCQFRCSRIATTVRESSALIKPPLFCQAVAERTLEQKGDECSALLSQLRLLQTKLDAGGGGGGPDPSDMPVGELEKLECVCAASTLASTLGPTRTLDLASNLATTLDLASAPVGCLWWAAA